MEGSSGAGMVETQSFSVKCQTMSVVPTIDCISQNRGSEMRKVNANLMCTPGTQAASNQRPLLSGIRSNHFKTGMGLLASGRDGSLP